MTLKIAIVANCQGEGIQSAVDALSNAPVTAYWYSIERANRMTPEDCAKWAEDLAKFDIILSQPQRTPINGQFASAVLSKEAKQFHYIPRITFSGFHPDVVGIQKGRHKARSPAGLYHSGIALGAFLLGLPPQRAQRLFNLYVYERLGYLSEFEQSTQFLEKQCQTIGFELAGAVEAWRQSGVFMHTPNHPAMAVLAWVARHILGRIGVPLKAERSDLPDVLGQHIVWPVYPELAGHLAVPGGTMIRMGLSHYRGKKTDVDIEEFVADSYAHYATLPRETLESDRSLWLRDTLGEFVH